MKQTKIILCLAVAVTLLAGCRKYDTNTFNFKASIEQLSNGEAKTHLVNEQWVYWVDYESISISTSMILAPTPPLLLFISTLLYLPLTYCLTATAK